MKNNERINKIKEKGYNLLITSYNDENEHRKNGN